jgi:hypothetical protein
MLHKGETYMEKLNWNMEDLHKGCILACIAHAIGVARYPDVANQHSWNGINYNVEDSSGGRGTVSFANGYCVGVFLNEKTERAYKNFKPALEHLQDVPEKIVELTEKETLQYTFSEDITTAFWGDAEGLFSNDTFDDFLECGGELLEKQAMDVESAICEWKDDYEFSEEEILLLKSIYERKIANPDAFITLNEKEIAMIGGDENKDELDMEECATSFEEIGIYFFDK